MKIVIIDKTETDAPFLSLWWTLGLIISGGDVRRRVGSWSEVYALLTGLTGPIKSIQVWGHGRAGAPLINGEHPDLARLAKALSGKVDADTELWWRACDVHKGPIGKAFAERVTRVVGVRSVGHCTVISAPNPAWQGKLCGLEPGFVPTWPDNGAGLPGVLTTRMTAPEWAYRWQEPR